ncbi:MAG: hypothetical protein KA369_06355 [Spirochaetes bacterium]|nr:hypothetical protein [Spirochaetota bacterium]
MYPKRMMVAGVILVVAAVALFVAAITMLGKDEDVISRAVRFDGSAAASIKQGDLVVVEGKVSVKNKILIHDFVDAASEHQVKGGSWSTLEFFRQPVLADLAHGEILLNSENLCSEAKGNNVLMTGEKSKWNHEVRYIGLRRGDPITAVGILASLAPAALTVKDWYSGSVADYKDSLSSSRKNLFILCPILALVGAGMFILGFRKR